MSDTQASGQGLPAASSSNATAYPPLPPPPSAEPDREGDEKAEGSAVARLAEKQAGKVDENAVKAVVKAVDKTVDKAVDKADDKTDGKTDDETDDETDDQDSGSPKMTPTEKFKIVEAILKAKEKNKDIQAAIEKALPPDVPVNFRQIQAAIHSDKFAGDEGKMTKAKEAFQILGLLRDNMETGSRKVDKGNAFFFGNDPSRPQAHAEEELSSYHDAAHKKATRHLKIIYDAVEDNPSPTPDNPPTEKMKASISKLDEINKEIREKNKKNHKDTDLGIVRYTDLLGKWRALLLSADEETKGQLKQVLLEFCKQMHYPTTWANQPPSYNKKNKIDTTQEINEGPSNQGTANQGAASMGLNQQEGFNMQSAPVSQYMTPQNGLTLVGTKQVIATTPRKTHRNIRPGYTSSGLRIRYIQTLGVVGGARYVVEDENGDVRLISSSAAGGQPTLKGARKVGVPSTLQDPEAIKDLRDLVESGGEYGLEFVAIGEWDVTQKKLPFIVVLFYHEIENTVRKEAISRSTLTKILATREAENLIVEAITGTTEMSLRDALISTLPSGMHDKIQAGTNGPLLLPYGGAPHPWWLQNPQQLGPQAALHSSNAQQQYLSHPQGFAPQYMQQPPPGQFQYYSPQYVPQFGKASPPNHQPFHQPQAGLSSIQAWPIFDPMTKHGAKSPVPSLMELDEKA